MLPFLAGLGLGLSLIVALGAQNLFVLRQGMRRERVLLVVAICMLSDAVLILAGVGGLGLALEHAPWLLPAARVLGAAFLLGYAVIAARRAWRGSSAPATPAPPGADGAPQRPSAAATARIAATALALTWLNPHVYLDTVLLLGSVAATYGDNRGLFATGAIAASTCWFASLGLGARTLGRRLRSARAWRILDGGIAVVMAALAASLLVPLLPG